MKRSKPRLLLPGEREPFTLEECAVAALTVALLAFAFGFAAWIN